MATLRSIAAEMAGSLGKPYDAEVIDRLKSYILQERALYYKRTIDKDGVDAISLQHYVCELTTKPALFTNIGHSTEGVVSNLILRTVNRIPRPVRVKGYGPFNYVGSLDKRTPFVQATPIEFEYAQHLPIIDSTRVIRYCVVNDYIYLDKNDLEGYLGKQQANHISITAVYENPFLAMNPEDNESGIHYQDDMEFPIPMDFLTNLKASLLKGNFGGVVERETD